MCGIVGFYCSRNDKGGDSYVEIKTHYNIKLK